jgi:hypothetical protein
MAASKLKVVCPNCGESYHETTNAYRKTKIAHPGMLRLVEPYLSWGWETPPPDPSAGYGALTCPGCGAALAPSGKLKVEGR